MQKIGMRRIWTVVILSMCLVVISYCHFVRIVGDGGFRVKGHIVSAKGNACDNYDIELYLAEDDRFLLKENISANFEKSFLIPPEKLEYYMIVSCHTHNLLQFKTPVYELGDVKYYRTPIGLGEITLRSP